MFYCRYRTQLCSYGTECKRSICFFAHDYSQLRITDQTQLLAMERELDAAGNGNLAFGFEGTSPMSRSQAAQVLQLKMQLQQEQQKHQRQQRQEKLLQAAVLMGADSSQLMKLRQLQQNSSNTSSAQVRQAALPAMHNSIVADSILWQPSCGLWH